LPVVGSNQIPFVKEYLLGNTPVDVAFAGMDNLLLKQGKGAIMVETDNILGFAAAMKRVLDDEGLRLQLAQEAMAITVPYFTWPQRLESFMSQIAATP